MILNFGRGTEIFNCQTEFFFLVPPNKLEFFDFTLRYISFVFLPYIADIFYRIVVIDLL